jgi:hypothetical protein
MNQGLLWLADSLRVSYGETGILAVCHMMLRALSCFQINVNGAPLPHIDPYSMLTLRWPDWYPMDALDRQRNAQTLESLVGGGLLSRETAMHILSSTYDIDDMQTELARMKGRTA